MRADHRVGGHVGGIETHSHTHRYIHALRVELEISWCAGVTVVAKREVAVAVCVAAAWSNVCRVDHVGVYKLDVEANPLEELRVPFLHVLAPEFGRFEELHTI